MREIKFRAFDLNERKMFDSIALSFLNYGREISSSFKLMQYTGLKDKNGKEIYEGDIVCVGDSFPKHKIVWNEYKSNFMLKNEDGMADMLKQDMNNLFEVIGNIFENGDLLE